VFYNLFLLVFFAHIKKTDNINFLAYHPIWLIREGISLKKKEVFVLGDKKTSQMEDLREIKNLKRLYNELLKIYKKAEIFFDSDATYERKLKHLPRMKTIIDSMGDVLYSLERYGEKTSEEEIENGFEIPEERVAS
jgi:uncharacterized membrane protein YgaE (UPF0421/DUF939 family)